MIDQALINLAIMFTPVWIMLIAIIVEEMLK